MITNWLVKFVDGTSVVVSADSINEAFSTAHETFSKHPRCASFHSSFTDSQVHHEFGFGWGPVGDMA